MRIEYLVPDFLIYSNLSAKMSLIADNITKIRNKIAALGAKTKLIAVSKNVEAQQIEEAIACGCTIFGENKVIEAKTKWLNLKNQYKNTQLHLIGHLQSNKAKDAVAIFDVIQTLDSIKLAKILQKEMTKQNKFPQIFAQINIGEETQKSGLMPQDAGNFIKKVEQECGIKISGLMAIAPKDKEPSLYFALLKKIADENNIQNISMGMSQDFEKAIAFGSDFIRVGKAIFGTKIGSSK
jgi:PLP dependent protein